MYNLGWFSTGRDKAARDLLRVVQDNIIAGELEAEIEFVFCSRDRSETEATDQYLNMAEEYGIPLVKFSYQTYKSVRDMPNPDPNAPLPQWRIDYDREVMKRLDDFTPDLCVLAGFMLITGPEICKRYDIINLHPAAPGGPTGTWQEVIWQLIESQAEETGVMMHLVTPELDKGPPVTYCTFSIRGEPFDSYWTEIRGIPIAEIKSEGENNRLFQLIRQHGLAREFPLIIATLKAFSQGKIRISPEKQVIDAEGKPIKGYNMTDEINELVKGVLL